MELSDLITIALVLVALWTFIPRHLRVALRSGLNPAVGTLADAVREVTRLSLKGLTVAAYRGLLGVPVPSVKSEDDSEEIEDVVEPVVTVDTAATAPIAKPNNEYSDELSKIKFEERARVVADLYKSGATTNLSKTICQVFSCSVQSSSKPESTYQRALREVNKHLPHGAQFRQEDGTTGPATRPVTGQRTHA
jgi:hypothetical protein